MFYRNLDACTHIDSFDELFATKQKYVCSKILLKFVRILKDNSNHLTNCVPYDIISLIRDGSKSK